VQEFEEQPADDLSKVETVSSKKIKNCGEKPTIEVLIEVTLARMKSVFVHPQNNSYPIFTLEVQRISMDYRKRCDCDQINARLSNFLIYDNTNYPNTLDPFALYTSAD
jgi:hypothetical protein